MSIRILAINPGSTSTRLAVFEDGRELLAREVRHGPSEPAAGRLALVKEFLAGAGLAVGDLSAVAARGAPLAPVPAGTYRVNDAMLADARSDRFVDHVSRTACVMADELARPAGVPAFVVDPVSVDEYEPVARLSGLPELPRRSLLHALSIRAAAHRFARESGRDLARLRLVVAHLGGGISIAAFRGGRMVDSADANGEGPMSPERSGGLRVDDLVDLCFSGKHGGAAEVKRLLTRGAGLLAHLGTADAVEVERRIGAGDATAKLAYEALARQVAKHVGALAVSAGGAPDAVILTGGLARSSMLVEMVSKQIGFLGRVVVYPGGDEMRALAEGVERVLTGRERPRIYPTGEEEG